MKIAVTGGSGHIGNVLIHALLEEGHQLSVLCHRNVSNLEQLPVRIVKGDLLDQESISKLLEGADAAIHCAAVISVTGDRSGNMRKVNVDGTALLLETAFNRKLSKVVYVSSIHAFRQSSTDEILNEQSPFTNESAPAYDRSKRDAHLQSLQYAAKGLDVSVVNPTSVVGPPDLQPSLMGQAIIKLCNDKVPALIPGGFDFVDVRDVVQGITGALKYGNKGATYLLAGKWYPISELAAMLSRIAGKRIHPPTLPVWLAKAGLPFINTFAAMQGTDPVYSRESIIALTTGNRHIDASKARRELGFHARPFSETLEDTYQWFLQHHYIKK